MSSLTRSTFTFPKASKPTERVKPMESSMNKNEQSPISAEDELKEKITKLTGEIHDLGFYSFEGEANYIRLNEIDAEICDLFEAYAQKKYQEGESNGLGLVKVALDMYEKDMLGYDFDPEYEDDEVNPVVADALKGSKAYVLEQLKSQLEKEEQ